MGICCNEGKTDGGLIGCNDSVEIGQKSSWT